MSGNAAPATVHSGILVKSRLPMLLHRVIPAGSLSLSTMGYVEAGLISYIVYYNGIRSSRAPMDMMETALAAGFGVGAYHMAPP